MNIFTQQLPGLSVGLLRIMFGILWLQAALQKAPWVINAQGQRFGWLSNNHRPLQAIGTPQADRDLLVILA